MKKIIFLIILFSWFKSEAQNKHYGPSFHLTRSHRWGALGISTSDTLFYADSLRVNVYKPLKLGFYTTATAPPATAFDGYIIYNTDSLKPQYSDGVNWLNLPGTAGGGGGSGTVTSVALAAGTTGTDVNISGSPITTSGTITLNIPDASATARGLVTNGTQVFGGNKTNGGNQIFNGTATFNGTVQAGGTANGVINIASSAASVRGSIDLASNNPRLNSATGTWIFAQAGNTMGLYNSTGFFFGGGTTPTARVDILAGTTTVPSLRLNLGVDQTTSLTGSFDFDDPGGIARLAFTPAGSTKKRFVLSNDAAPSNGQIPIGNGTDYTAANIASADGTITITNGAGTIDLKTTLLLTASTYTPTTTNGTNVDAVTVPGTTLYYQRIGNQITVWGQITVDATAGSTITNLFISLPVASAMTGLYQLSGQMTSWASGGAFGGIEADVTNDRANLSFQNGSATGAVTYTIRFSYEVL